MKIKPVLKGEPATLPVRHFNDRQGGWSTRDMDQDGFVVVLNASEKIDAGVFISLEQLQERLSKFNKRIVLEDISSEE